MMEGSYRPFRYPMRKSLLALTAAVVLLLRVPLHGDLLVYGVFGDYVDALRVQAGIPGLSAAIVGADDILWERAYGRQNVERAIATRPDTPFQFDGVTQIVTSSVILRCVEDGRLSLDDRIGRFDPASADASATVRQVLSHTSGSANSQVFAYRPERYNALLPVMEACAANSFRATVASGFDRFAMVDSVPGDVSTLVPPADGISPQTLQRYLQTLQRLATPYSIDTQKRATPTQYTAATLTGSSGLVSTVRDYARLDLAIRKNVLLRPDSLTVAWRAPVGANGQPLPHGLGWFVQTYNGEKVVWQFGVSDNASSSIVVTVPSRQLTLILLANSDGLAKSFPLAAGDVTVSPFVKVFLGIFVR